MTTTLRLAAVTVFGLLLLGCAGGCGATDYAIKVNNLADQPVTATIWQRTEGRNRAMVARYIGPQDSHNFEVEGKVGGNVWLGVDFAGNEGAPAELPLATGLTVVNVRRPDEGGRGRLMLQEVE